MSVKHLEILDEGGDNPQSIHRFNWILSHGSTLEELNLDRCSILYQIGHCIEDWQDDDGYPVGKETDSGELDYGWSSDPGWEDVSKFYFNNWGRRWHEVLPEFAISPRKLLTFRFGSSQQWNLDVESRYAEQGNRGTFRLPIMPWRDEENLVSSILDDRYMIWDDYQQQYRAHWRIERNIWEEDFLGFNGYGEPWPDEVVEQLQSFPDCETEDRDALELLLEVIRSVDRDVYFCKDDCSCEGTHH
ncbi:hypothetical protein G6514_001578 [Epicoccum nigrum]|nr:hypothetical protein G6514_001578 [Epicoccum nigrum]